MPSRQRRWQLRQRAKGLCEHCSSPSIDGHRCAKHLLANRAIQRGKTGKAWTIGSVGRPPKHCVAPTDAKPPEEIKS